MTNHTPIAVALFNQAKTGYIPAIHYPARTVAHLQDARFPRKTKATAIEAIAYAEAVILYRRLVAPPVLPVLPAQRAYINAMAQRD